MRKAITIVPAVLVSIAAAIYIGNFAFGVYRSGVDAEAAKRASARRMIDGVNQCIGLYGEGSEWRDNPARCCSALDEATCRKIFLP